MDKPSIRLDKWLWHARVVKTRTLAQKLVTGGKVRVNRTKITTPSRNIVPGDVLTIALPQSVRIYEVVAIGTRRGPFEEAKRLYLDRSPPPEKQEPEARQAEISRGARPNSRQRRQLAALRGKII